MAKKILIEITELDGGYKASVFDKQADIESPSPLGMIGDETYAETLSTGTKGLFGRLHNRVVQFFEKE